jgi:hypothetical protein
LNLTQWELKKGVGLPACVKKGPAGALVLASVGKLPPSVSKNLGVEEWR